MIEKEYKYLVEKSDYCKLLDEIKDKSRNYSEKIQINYYYDTTDFLIYRQGKTIRIRHSEDKLKLQLKNHLNISEYVTSEEKCIDIEYLPQSIQIKTDIYSMIGNLITYRTIFNMDDEVKIMFDKNYYLGKIDYEIEIEFVNSLSKELEEYLNNINIKFNEKGKYARFVENKLDKHKDLIYKY